MSDSLTIGYDVRFHRGGRGSRRLMEPGRDTPVVFAGRVPRIARLMALAIRFDGLIRAGEVADYAELARLGQVTRARMTQVMNLLLLAPDIQERLLHLPNITSGRDLLHIRDLQPIAAVADWRKQRAGFEALLRRANPGPER